MGLEVGEGLHDLIGIFDQTGKGLAQTKEVPVSDLGLLGVAVATLVIGVVTDVLGIKCVHELKGAVINGQPQNAHVVGVHHPMTKAHPLPLRHELRIALGTQGQKSQTLIGEADRR